MHIRKLPIKELAPFIRELWFVDRRDADISGASRENVLPSGAMHLVFRLSGKPLRVFDGESATEGRDISAAVVGGMRSRFYSKDVSDAAYSIGAVLKPGVAGSVFGFSAEELSCMHTPLDDIWGRSVNERLEMIAEAPSLEVKFEKFESFIANIIYRREAPDLVVLEAVNRFRNLDRIDSVVRDSGFCHRHFAKIFRRQVGLHPKAYSRIHRFRKTLELVASGQLPLSDIAYFAGYSDQAHFSRDFKEFSGITPGFYRKIAPRHISHVPIK